MFCTHKSTNITEEFQDAVLVMRNKFSVAKKAVLCLEFLNINCTKYLCSFFTIMLKKLTSAVDKHQKPMGIT
jgi:hypothetical protein